MTTSQNVHNLTVGSLWFLLFNKLQCFKKKKNLKHFENLCPMDFKNVFHKINLFSDFT